MKKLRLFTMLSAFALAAAGATGLASLREGKKAEIVQADTPSSFTNLYRFTVPNDFGSDVGNHIYLHATGSNGGDTTWGNFITLSDYSYNENSQRVYTFGTSYSYTKFVIVRYYDNPTYCQTNDINVGSDKAWSWSGTSHTDASPWTPTNQTYYLYDYKNLFGGNAKCYAWQSGGSLNNGSYPGPAMTKVQYGSGQLYSINLDPAFDRVKFGIGDSANTGDQWCNQNRGGTFCWWDAGDGSWSNDLDWVKAHDWIYQSMHMRDILQTDKNDTGACRGANGYYQKAKTAYTNYSSAIKTKMAADDLWEAAQARFVDWASANGEKASWSGTGLTVNARNNILYGNSNYSTNTIAIIVIASLVSVTAIGGYFFIKRRKTN